jgi:hypothetical protein
MPSTIVHIFSLGMLFKTGPQREGAEIARNAATGASESSCSPTNTDSSSLMDSLAFDMGEVGTQYVVYVYAFP